MESCTSPTLNSQSGRLALSVPKFVAVLHARTDSEDEEEGPDDASVLEASDEEQAAGEPLSDWLHCPRTVAVGVGVARKQQDRRLQTLKWLNLTPLHFETPARPCLPGGEQLVRGRSGAPAASL